MAEKKDTPAGRKAKTSKPRVAMGRGLGAILGDSTTDPAPSETGTVLKDVLADGTDVAAVHEVPLDAIEKNPYQPRTEFDETALQELADSIAQQGIIQPITVRRLGKRQFQLIAGERRLRAAKRLGLATVPAYVREADDEQMMEMALIENVQRDDLNPMEVALAYQRLMDECNLKLHEVGEKVGKKRATVNNYVRLLRLPPAVQKGLREGDLSMGHARALLALERDDQTLELYRQTVAKQLSVRAVEAAVKKLLEEPTTAPTSGAPPSAFDLQLKEVTRELERYYDTRITVQRDGDGRGEIRLKFFSNDDLNRLLDKLNG